MTGDRTIRALTAVVVLAVAAFAAVVSYSHIYDLGRVHGQAGTAARLLPLSVDGLILAAGLVLLHAARRQAPAPVLARCMLWLGITATVGANVAYGARYGVLGAVISAWPAVAFVGSAEMALGLVRSAREPVPGVPVADPAAGNAAPAHLIEAQRVFGEEIAAGSPPTIRAIRAALSVGQDKAREVQAHLAGLTRT
jgi:hypothetical protein